MARRSALVSQVLEHLSGSSFDRYPALIRACAQGQAGVYALYKRSRLYYVGLASNLSGRLKRHLVDRHKSRWDSFSLYLVRDRGHIKDLESLLLRIARPRGNSQAGKFVQYEDLRRKFRADMRRENRRREGDVMGDDPPAPGGRGGGGHGREDGAPVLAQYMGGMTTSRGLLGTYHGHQHRARVLRDGSISVKGKRFASPSTAGSAVMGGRSCNGWLFWKYEKGPGNWRRLKELQR